MSFMYDDLSWKKEYISMKKDIYRNLTRDLRSGKDVVCLKCGKGIYRPFNTTPDKAHSFTCDKCGDNIHFTPNITVEQNN